ncbi:MAG: DUF1328 domain-containing protein [Gemmataceae bacterium]|nr:DUF1328 domain-containing protein [Gemmataceae bacterium]
MLRLAVVFLLAAMAAALLGFGLIADLTYDAAKVAFVVFLVLAVMTFIADAFREPMAGPV